MQSQSVLVAHEIERCSELREAQVINKADSYLVESHMDVVLTEKGTRIQVNGFGYPLRPCTPPFHGAGWIGNRRHRSAGEVPLDPDLDRVSRPYEPARVEKRDIFCVHR